MLAIPIPVSRYLPPLLSAAKRSGYIGLVFVLARAADARDQYAELARDWASLHDVTGPLIGVLCPSSTGQPPESVVKRNRDEGVGVQGLIFEHASKADDRQFERAFWDAASKDPQIRDAMARFKQTLQQPDIIMPQPPLPPAELAAAWTAVTTESAQYFGIAEGSLPCLLVMSLREQASVVVRLRPALPIYRLFRETMLAFGDEPARIAALHDQQKALTEKLQTTPRQKDHVAYRSWKAKLEHLDSAIGASEDIDAELRARCQTALRRVLETGEPGDAPAALAALHQQIPTTADGPSLRHSAVWGLMKQLTVSGAIPSRPSDPDRVEVLESERTQAREQERAMREHLHLSSAVIAAYTQVLVPPTVEPVPGRGALQGWTVQYIDRKETPPPRATDRRG
jgi:hypothetical protein